MDIVETGKRLRASVQANEAKICQACPVKETCKVSFIPGQPAETRAFEDLHAYLKRLAEDEVD